MANPIAAIGQTVVNGVIQNRSADRATDAQTRAANQQIALQRETRDLIRKDMSPFLQGGQAAQNALQYELGLGERPENYAGFQATPGYDFARNEALDAVESSAAARSGLYSGAAMQALQERGNNLANLEYNNFLNRIQGMSGSGQNAAAGMAAVNQNTANQIGQAYGNIGNAQAAGAIAQGNALSGAINNGIGLWQYQNTLNQGGGFG